MSGTGKMTIHEVTGKADVRVQPVSHKYVRLYLMDGDDIIVQWDMNETAAVALAGELLAATR